MFENCHADNSQGSQSSQGRVLVHGWRARAANDEQPLDFPAVLASLPWPARQKEDVIVTLKHGKYASVQNYFIVHDM